jgi:hypothetical protein
VRVFPRAVFLDWFLLLRRRRWRLFVADEETYSFTDYDHPSYSSSYYGYFFSLFDSYSYYSSGSYYSSDSYYSYGSYNSYDSYYSYGSYSLYESYYSSDLYYSYDSYDSYKSYDFSFFDAGSNADEYVDFYYSFY